VRSWAIQLATYDETPSGALAAKMAELAKTDPSPVVRLAIASGLQRLPLPQRWSIVEALIAHGEDATDLNLPLMIWYGAEPLVPADPSRAAELVLKSRIPIVREYIARRLASYGG
jgi:hypothetical protein